MRQGILRNPNTRAYTLPDGTILSNRAMQQRASFVRYGESLTLEQRAAILERAGYRSGQGVKSNWVRGVMRSQTWARGLKYREVERLPRFKEVYEQWKYLRSKKGGSKDAMGIRRPPGYWNRQRFNFLKRYGVLVFQGGDWISPERFR